MTLAAFEKKEIKMFDVLGFVRDAVINVIANLPSILSIVVWVIAISGGAIVAGLLLNAAVNPMMEKLQERSRDRFNSSH